MLATVGDRIQDQMALNIVILKLPFKTICMKRQCNMSPVKFCVLLMKFLLEMPSIM